MIIIAQEEWKGQKYTGHKLLYNVEIKLVVIQMILF